MIGLTSTSFYPIFTTWQPISQKQQIDIQESIQAFSLHNRIISPHFSKRQKDLKEKLQASLHLIKSCDSISHIFLEKVSARFCKNICLIEFSNLKDLSIPQNNIQTIQWIFCLHAINLTKLDLSRNKIVSIRPIVKANIPALEDINLGKNFILDLRSLEVSHLPNLSSVSIQTNEKKKVYQTNIGKVLPKLPSKSAKFFVNLPREDVFLSNKDLYQEAISKRFYDNLDNWEIFDEDFMNSEFQVSDNEQNQNEDLEP